MGDRFYQQQKATIQDFVLDTFKSKPTKAAVIKELQNVFPFFDDKTAANTTTLAGLLAIVDYLKEHPFEVTGGGTVGMSNKKQPYVEFICSSSNFTDLGILKSFSVKGLRDLSKFINEGV